MEEPIATAPADLAGLPLTEVNFINTKVSHSFLKKYGTPTGFNEFCRIASRAGLFKNCSDGVRKNKEAYATYLRNARVGGKGKFLYENMKDDYAKLDNFTKVGMATKVRKGKELSEQTTGALKKGNIYPICETGKFTVPQLREMAKNKGAHPSDLKGMRKAELCALVDGLMENGEAYWEFASGKGPAIPWKEYPFKPSKKKTEEERIFAQYEKSFGSKKWTPKQRARFDELKAQQMTEKEL